MKLIRKIKSINIGPKIAILGCVHGDEIYSLSVFRRLKKINLLKGEIDFYLVNYEAYLKRKRFIDGDLNRSFNTNLNNYESNLTKIICEKLKNYDYIVDIHSTTSNTNPFLIYVNPKLNNDSFLDYFNIKKRVFIPNAKYSLISQFENAISIEISISSKLKYAINKAEKYLLSFLKNLKIIEGHTSITKFKEDYICIGKIKKDNNLKDFKLTKIDGEFIYPMLSKEVNYGQKYCFKLKRVYL